MLKAARNSLAVVCQYGHVIIDMYPLEPGSNRRLSSSTTAKGGIIWQIHRPLIKVSRNLGKQVAGELPVVDMGIHLHFSSPVTPLNWR